MLDVTYSLPSERVIAALERAGGVRRLPARLLCDRGSEFSSRQFLSRARASGIALDFIRHGKPVGNAYVESFNSKPHATSA
jgi:putative transposase